MTLKEARDTVLSKLGDTTNTPASARVWSEAEIEGYFRDAVRDFSYRTRIVWDMAYLDDLPYTGGYNFEFEKPLFAVGKVMGKQFRFTAEWEKDFISSQLPAANHTNMDERDDFLITSLIAAVEQLPKEAIQIDRVLYDGRRIDNMSSRVLANLDNYYEIIRGPVFGYLQDKDGLRSFRKYKVPSAVATYYWALGKFGVLRGSAAVAIAQTAPLNMHIDEWGILLTAGLKDAPLSIGWDFPPPGANADIPINRSAITALTEFSNDHVQTAGNSGFGILRRLPGYFPAKGPWGFVKKLSNPQRNTRIEFFKKAKVPSNPLDTFDIPDYMVKYLRHYVMSTALSRVGIGQDPALADHYEQRYEMAIARTRERANAAFRTRLVRMGGSGAPANYPPKPYGQLPRNLPSS